MPFQYNNTGFSLPEVFRRKAQREGNGQLIVISIVEHCNATSGHHRQALRLRLSAPTDCVTPLNKGATINCELCLAANSLAMNLGNLAEPTLLH